MQTVQLKVPRRRQCLIGVVNANVTTVLVRAIMSMTTTYIAESFKANYIWNHHYKKRESFVVHDCFRNVAGVLSDEVYVSIYYSAQILSIHQPHINSAKFSRKLVNEYREP